MTSYGSPGFYHPTVYGKTPVGATAENVPASAAAVAAAKSLADRETRPSANPAQEIIGKRAGYATRL